jgi:hypothetical protein
MISFILYALSDRGRRRIYSVFRCPTTHTVIPNTFTCCRIIIAHRFHPITCYWLVIIVHVSLVLPTVFEQAEVNSWWAPPTKGRRVVETKFPNFPYTSKTGWNPYNTHQDCTKWIMIKTVKNKQTKNQK